MAIVADQVLNELGRLNGRERNVVRGTLLAGTLLRLFVIPTKLVMIYSAYRLAAETYMFVSVPKYGPTTLVLYRIAFAFFGTSHETMVWVNVACGVMSMPVIVALFARFRPPPWSVPFAAGLVALTPLFMHDHRTESILVPTLFFLWCGLLLWDLWLEKRGAANLAGVAVFFTLALMGRPEMYLVVALTAGAIAYTRHEPGAWKPRLVPLGIGLAAVAALNAPNLLHLRMAVAEQVAQEALPAMRAGVGFIEVVFTRNLLMKPVLWPLALTLLAIAGWTTSDGTSRRFARAVWVAVLVWIGSYFVDLPQTSMPRLQATPATFIALVAALGFGNALARGRLARWSMSRRNVTLVSIGSVVVLAIPSAIHYFTTDNEQEEERLINHMMEQLPDEKVCFIRLGDDDDPAPRKVHRYFPDYLMRPPRRSDNVLGIRAWQNAELDLAVDCPGGVYYAKTLRCYSFYLAFEDTDADRTEPDLLSSCRWMEREARLDPVFTERIPNYGNNEYRYYPNVDAFDVGLYRVQGRKNRPKEPPRTAAGAP